MTKKINNEVIDTAMELTQKTASLTLKGAVQTVEVTENYVQGMYVAGYNANVEALKVVKGYWDATSQIRQDWVQLFATTGENFIKAAGNMELPLQKEAFELGKNLYANVEKSVENFNKQAKAATK
jgi:hypothetical protein